MSASSTGPPSPGGRIFRAAWAVLGVIAAAQAAAVAMARRDPPPAAALSPAGPSASPSGAAAAASPQPEDPFRAEAAPADDPHPEMAVPPGTEPPVPDPVTAEAGTTPPPPAKPAPLDTPITDEECLVLLERGMDARSKGDMHAAVTDLRAALARMPHHPRLLYPLASTLDMMAQEAKAKPHWAALFALGPGTGEYYEMARYRLTGEGSAAKTLASGAAAPPADPEEGEGRLVLEKMAGEEMAPTAEGQILRFSGAVVRKQDEPVDVAKMGIVIHLFDMVNGRRIDRTTAITPEVTWDSAPVDWTDRTETFHFEYNQPMMSPGDIVRFGQRKYMGFVMMLYYNDKLQNVASDVPQLLDFAREIPVEDPATPSSELLDAPPPAVPGQPDGALFPGDMVPAGPLR